MKRFRGEQHVLFRRGKRGLALAPVGKNTTSSVSSGRAGSSQHSLLPSYQLRPLVGSIAPASPQLRSSAPYSASPSSTLLIAYPYFYAARTLGPRHLYTVSINSSEQDQIFPIIYEGKFSKEKPMYRINLEESSFTRYRIGNLSSTMTSRYHEII